MADPQVAPEGAPQEPQAQGGAGQFQDLASNVVDGLSMIADVVGSAQGLDPKLQAVPGQILEAFKQFVQALQSGGAPAGPQGAEAASMEAGANPNARPMGPQGAM